jgi:hypothetical protein
VTTRLDPDARGRGPRRPQGAPGPVPPGFDTRTPSDQPTNAQEDTEQGFSLRPWATGVLRRYWTPPKLWGRRAASLDDLSNYAHHGEWTSRTGFLRALGIGWWRLVGLPVTWLCRRIEWISQRPGRTFAVLVVVKLAAHTGPGQFVLEWLGVALHWLAWLAL